MIRQLITFIPTVFFSATAVLFSTLTSAPVNAGESLSVTLPDMEISLNYAQPVRLDQVLTDTQNLKLQQPQAMPFWLAAQFIEPSNNADIDEKKKAAIHQLQTLAANDKDSSHKAHLLINALQKAQFNFRHFIPLDNDHVRLKNEDNPLLSGQYTLLTSPRVNKVRIFGTQNSWYPVDMIEHGTIDQYLEQAALPENSDTQLVFVIQPDGALITADNAYWNTKPVFIAPGATIYIGFDSLPDEFEHLNQDIADLLRYQTPLTDKDAE
ncbi:hypothetical protein DI392_05520 [Vibrio albus]|uniref:Uncharacterized protein n=1 Tax=Vibrio albus TaxID=2200953 RepID=A0A2U3BCS7_9VIBR|nr:capsule biosynthesis GfcC family protein [Vibrio albus]PWI34565.1 hypothetical protein DI392_05520 [Vibrio albus]